MDADRLHVTVLKAAKGALLTKRFTLAAGKLIKTAAAQLADRTADLTGVADLRAFADLLESLPASSAVTYGVAAGHPSARIVSLKRHTDDAGTITRTRRYFGYRRAPGIMFLDYDPQKSPRECSPENPPKPTKPTKTALTPAELIADLRTVAPWALIIVPASACSFGVQGFSLGLPIQG